MKNKFKKIFIAKIESMLTIFPYVLLIHKRPKICLFYKITMLADSKIPATLYNTPVYGYIATGSNKVYIHHFTY